MSEPDDEESNTDDEELEEEGKEESQGNTHRDRTQTHSGCSITEEHQRRYCEAREEQEGAVCQCMEHKGAIPNDEETSKEGSSVPMIQMTHVGEAGVTRPQAQGEPADVLVDTGAFTNLVSKGWFQRAHLTE